MSSGSSPSPALQQLERSILTHDPVSDAPTRQVGARDRQPAQGGLLVVAGALVLLAAAVRRRRRRADGHGNPSAPRLVAADSVGVIDPGTNTIVGQIPVGSTPTADRSGRGGVWVVSEQDETVTRIDPTTRTVFRTIAVGGPPIDVVVGADAVWLLVSGKRRRTAWSAATWRRIDPSVLRRRRANSARHRPLRLRRRLQQPRSRRRRRSGWSLRSLGVTVARIDDRHETGRTDVRRSAGLTWQQGNARVGGGCIGNRGRRGRGMGRQRARCRPAQPRALKRSRRPFPSRGRTDRQSPSGKARSGLSREPAFQCCPAEGDRHRHADADRSERRTRSRQRSGWAGRPAAVAVADGSVWIADPGNALGRPRRSRRRNRVSTRIKVGATPTRDRGRRRPRLGRGGLTWLSRVQSSLAGAAASAACPRAGDRGLGHARATPRNHEAAAAPSVWGTGADAISLDAGPRAGPGVRCGSPTRSSKVW